MVPGLNLTTKIHEFICANKFIRAKMLSNMLTYTSWFLLNDLIHLVPMYAQVDFVNHFVCTTKKMCQNVHGVEVEWNNKIKFVVVSFFPLNKIFVDIILISSSFCFSYLAIKIFQTLVFCLFVCLCLS